MNKHHFSLKFRAFALIVAMIATSLLTITGALANYANSLINPLGPGISTSAGVAPAPGAPPPIGCGDTPLPVIGGDAQGTNQTPPSGTVQAPSNNPPEQVRSTVNLLLNEAAGTDWTGNKVRQQESHGMHVVLTFRGDQLSTQQQGNILSTLGMTNFSSGSQNIVVTSDQLLAIQNQLFPYPQYQVQDDGRKFIDSDSPASGYPKYQTSDPFNMPANFPKLSNVSYLSTVRQLCRYLVLAGVVCSTLYMIFAAFSVIMGHREGGARVIASAGGLMLLLCAFTIWKIVTLNTGYYGETEQGAVDVITKRNDSPKSNPQPPDTPTVPTAWRQTPARSNIPVQPLSGPIYR